MITRGAPSFLDTLRASISVSLPLAGIACGITLLFLGMRTVMDVGGACADGGPYVSAQPCPDGIPLAMHGGIWGGLICVGLYIWQTLKYRVPGLVAFAWPALFLSLGWNFLEYGINPPWGDGLAWGWLVCAVLFGLMGGLPLLAITRPVLRSFAPRDPQGPVSFRSRPHPCGPRLPGAPLTVPEPHRRPLPTRNHRRRPCSTNSNAWQLSTAPAPSPMPSSTSRSAAFWEARRDPALRLVLARPPTRCHRRRHLRRRPSFRPHHQVTTLHNSGISWR